MKRLILITMVAVLASACGSRKQKTTEGMTEMKSPFSEDKYQSNRRFFRATGSGESINLETARSMALLMAKQRLASSVQTQIKSVQESFSTQRDAQGGAEFEERFSNLTREVLNQIIVDVAVIGEKTFKKPDNHYQIHVALEARKKTTYKKLKEIAMQRTSLSDKDKKYVGEMIDKAIEDLDDGD